MGAEYVCIRAGAFRADIRLRSILELNAAPFRKLMRLMRSAEGENRAAIDQLGAYFSAAAAETKAGLDAASQAFSNGWMDPKRHFLYQPQRRKNAQLKASLKNAKSRYDRVLKFQSIFKGEQNV